jgi:hypothetical protein
MATLEFFRFRFGVLEISAFFVLLGLPLSLVFRKPKKSEPN